MIKALNIILYQTQEQELQRQCSPKYLLNKRGGSYQKTKNIAKLEKKIKKLHSRLTHITLNHIHQATSKIVKTKPFRIAMEDLNVTGMMKNKHLSKAITEQCSCGFIVDGDKNAAYNLAKYGLEISL